jgi:hypothetical protein
VEAALRENVAGSGPQFDDPAVPCLQLFGLQPFLDGDTALSVTTYQDDTKFGLRTSPESGFLDEWQWDGIYRRRSLTELPVGQIEQVALFVDNGVVAEVHLRIGAQPLLLIAGEVDETLAGELLFHRLEESILAFIDPTAAEHVPWTTPRPALARAHHGVNPGEGVSAGGE